MKFIHKVKNTCISFAFTSIEQTFMQVKFEFCILESHNNVLQNSFAYTSIKTFMQVKLEFCILENQKNVLQISFAYTSIEQTFMQVKFEFCILKVTRMFCILLITMHIWQNEVFSWLTGRRQRVVINDVSFSWGNVIIGVPRGSVLEPLLIFIYINDIDTDLFSKICKRQNNMLCSSNRR